METMGAFVIEAPGRAGVQEVPVPDPAPGQVVVRVERAGVGQRAGRASRRSERSTSR
jgi:D-arabinose 1-dehydrogenase-like Zn-dependent alcohol dehydrogenase